MSVKQRLLESLFYTIVLYASLGEYTVCFVQSWCFSITVEENLKLVNSYLSYLNTSSRVSWNVLPEAPWVHGHVAELFRKRFWEDMSCLKS